MQKLAIGWLAINRDKRMRISIAMATYNGASYLEEQLQSFLNQARLPDELIITDDCSADETTDIIRCFAERAPFKVWWEQNEKKLGYSGNFNKALSYTTGDLVFLSDQDDVWFFDKIEAVTRLASASSALVLMNDAILTDANLTEVGLTKLGQIRSAGLPSSSFVMGCCAAIKRDLLDLCLPVPKSYPAHDSWIVKFADGMKRKQVIEQCLQYYRRHGSNESQFIANRTRKVTRWHVFLDRLNKIMKRDQSPKEFFQNQQTLLKGVQKARERSSEPFQLELKNFEGELRTYISMLEKRITIRSNPKTRRILPVASLLMQGGYKNFSGVVGAARDIIFD